MDSARAETPQGRAFEILSRATEDLVAQRPNWQAERIQPTLGLPHWEQLAATVQALEKMTQGRFRHLPVVEDGETFDDNAYKKASFTARVLGYPALADDSGLMVAALDGAAPGL